MAGGAGWWGGSGGDVNYCTPRVERMGEPPHDGRRLRPSTCVQESHARRAGGVGGCVCRDLALCHLSRLTREVFEKKKAPYIHGSQPTLARVARGFSRLTGLIFLFSFSFQTNRGERRGGGKGSCVLMVISPSPLWRILSMPCCEGKQRGKGSCASRVRERERDETRDQNFQY